jgi:hypothetical protein
MKWYVQVTHSNGMLHSIAPEYIWTDNPNERYEVVDSCATETDCITTYISYHIFMWFIIYNSADYFFQFRLTTTTDSNENLTETYGTSAEGLDGLSYQLDPVSFLLPLAAFLPSLWSLVIWHQSAWGLTRPTRDNEGL